MSLYSMLAGKGPNGFGYGSTAEQVSEGVSLAGKTILVTGCNSGLGLETMRVLSKRGAHVIGSARTETKASEAGRSVGGKVTGVACELSDPKSVRAAVKTIQDKGAKLDTIVANAGIMALPKLETAFGYELQFFTNHIGHFMLVTGLLDTLRDDARVVILSSGAHTQAPDGGIAWDNLDGKKGYSSWTFYGQSKFANILFAKELAKKLKGKQTANALHPGVIATNLSRHTNIAVRGALALGSAIAMKSVPQGAATQTYLAANPGAAGITGEYWSDCNVAKCRADACDPALATKLWQRSEEIVAGLPA